MRRLSVENSEPNQLIGYLPACEREDEADEPVEVIGESIENLVVEQVIGLADMKV